MVLRPDQVMAIDPSGDFCVRSITAPDVQWIDCDGTTLGVDYIHPEQPEVVQRWRFPLAQVAELHLSEP